jgi:hypothetical protein
MKSRIQSTPKMILTRLAQERAVEVSRIIEDIGPFTVQQGVDYIIDNEQKCPSLYGLLRRYDGSELARRTLWKQRLRGALGNLKGLIDNDEVYGRKHRVILTYKDQIDGELHHDFATRILKQEEVRHQLVGKADRAIRKANQRLVNLEDYIRLLN